MLPCLLRKKTLQSASHIPTYIRTCYFSTKVLKRNWNSIGKTIVALRNMGSKDNSPNIDTLRSSVKEQGDLIRKLKEENADQIQIQQAVRELKHRKKVLEEKELLSDSRFTKFDRPKFEDFLKRRFFFAPAFEIYGGVAGLYDYGPSGCAIEANVLNLWRSHFVLEEQMLEIKSTQLTPHVVLKASGHVDRFTDYMVKDVKTGECYRADHLLKAILEGIINNKNTSVEKKNECELVLAQLDDYDQPALAAKLKEYNAKFPGTNNDITEPAEFNLMFGTSIGPTGLLQGFLRPETAQGIFVNFKRLLDYNNGKLPFASAQIGGAFRNEISPRSGLLRVREFTLAEIEHFVDPSDKSHPKFENVQNVQVTMFPGSYQMSGKPAFEITLKEAYETNVINSTTVGYFIGRVHLFLCKIGVDPSRLRFRQHLANEMAHYACDCWDAEIKNSYGWIECVGIADRACYDLSVHTKSSGVKLVAQVDLAEPTTVKVVEPVLNKAPIGKSFKKDAKQVTEHLTNLAESDLDKLESSLDQNGTYVIKIGEKEYTITKDMVKEVKRYEKDVHVREVEPHVIEPSFGIGRIIYSLLEHNFHIREEDEQRTWLSLPSMIAPVKCSILPLSKNKEFDPFVKTLSNRLNEYDISHRIDDSAGSIGRRYARTDEIGIPFGVTIDFDTVNKQPSTVTLRERNSMKQIRLPIDVLPNSVSDLIRGGRKWESMVDEYGIFLGQETTK
ncbi:glycine--tRNA ligase-like [Dendronephthya gigantea]|uniref:glycine--tRNA ligase-like n=1 Tax=Dendronephthya gigantea TaxID=151771 RepID=UPI00106BA889|nr:glycine--tRNA ligase-like [Dendronephthya gigantea]